MTTDEADHIADTRAVALLARALRDLIVAGDHLRRVLATREGIGLSEFIAVSQLYFNGSCGPGELTRDLGLTPGSMTVLLDHLESMDMVRRNAHPIDGRRQVVSLTAKGRASHTAAFGSFAAAVHDAFTEQQELDVATLTRFLDATVVAVRDHADGLARAPGQVRP